MIDAQKLDEIQQYIRQRFSNNLDMPVVEILGSKWMMGILFYLYKTSPMRFGALKRSLYVISNTVLSSALHDLLQYKLITREQFNEMPLRVEYSITDAGRELLELSYQLIQWERKFFP